MMVVKCPNTFFPNIVGPIHHQRLTLWGFFTSLFLGFFITSILQITLAKNVCQLQKMSRSNLLTIKISNVTMPSHHKIPCVQFNGQNN